MGVWKDTAASGKPPLGMVIFMPTHDHGEKEPCHELCAFRQWEEHVERYGNPYPRMPGMTLEELHEQIIPAKREPEELGPAGLLIYQSNGMAGEAGEVANVTKKMARNGEMHMTKRRDQLLDECGDTLFYMSRLLRLRGLTLENAGRALLLKLAQQRKLKALEDRNDALTEAEGRTT